MKINIIVVVEKIINFYFFNIKKELLFQNYFKPHLYTHYSIFLLLDKNSKIKNYLIKILT